MRSLNNRVLIVVGACSSVMIAPPGLSQSGPAIEVGTHQKISSNDGNFEQALEDQDQFGRSVTAIGDLDGDGVGDIAVGAYRDDDGGDSRGAVWILFLNTDGTVKSHQKISQTEGGFGGLLDDSDFFGV